MWFSDFVWFVTLRKLVYKLTLNDSLKKMNRFFFDPIKWINYGQLGLSKKWRFKSIYGTDGISTVNAQLLMKHLTNSRVKPSLLVFFFKLVDKLRILGKHAPRAGNWARNSRPRAKFMRNACQTFVNMNYIHIYITLEWVFKLAQEW